MRHQQLAQRLHPVLARLPRLEEELRVPRLPPRAPSALAWPGVVGAPEPLGKVWWLQEQEEVQERTTKQQKEEEDLQQRSGEGAGGVAAAGVPGQEGPSSEQQQQQQRKAAREQQQAVQEQEQAVYQPGQQQQPLQEDKEEAAPLDDRFGIIAALGGPALAAAALMGWRDYGRVTARAGAAAQRLLEGPSLDQLARVMADRRALVGIGY